MRNVFVVGLDDFNLALMASLPEAADMRFHPLYTAAAIKQRDDFPVRALLRDAREQLQAFPGRVDAVVGYWDFPVSTCLPIIRQDAGLPGPSLESVLKCEHKYWSRREQQATIPESIPRFQAIDPFDEGSVRRLEIDFPFWIKPVKSVLSNLGFRVEDRQQLDQALSRIRAGIARYAEPFNYVLGFASLPREIAAVDGYHCIVEAIISEGHQCTVEGFARDGKMTCYGIVDSLREGPAASSFSRYQYPSRLPAPVRQRMERISETIMTRVGFDNSPFNIEYYWDPHTDAIRLLEINTRLSKSHAPLFQLVDGVPHYRVMLATAMGEAVSMPQRRGEYPLAAKFMVRRYGDARVSRVPDAQRIREVEQAVPGTRIQVHPGAGQWLSELRDQDSYSYEVAVVSVGGRDGADLEAKYQRCLALLELEFVEEGESP